MHEKAIFNARRTDNSRIKNRPVFLSMNSLRYDIVNQCQNVNEIQRHFFLFFIFHFHHLYIIRIHLIFRKPFLFSSVLSCKPMFFARHFSWSPRFKFNFRSNSRSRASSRSIKRLPLEKEQEVVKVEWVNTITRFLV